MEMTAPQKLNQIQGKLEPALTLNFRALFDFDKLQSYTHGTDVWSVQMCCFFVFFPHNMLLVSTTSHISECLGVLGVN